MSERHIQESQAKATHLHHSPSRRRIVDSAVLLLSLDASLYMGHVFLQVIAMMTASATMPQARPTSIPVCGDLNQALSYCTTQHCVLQLNANMDQQSSMRK